MFTTPSYTIQTNMRFSIQHNGLLFGTGLQACPTEVCVVYADFKNQSLFGNTHILNELSGGEILEEIKLAGNRSYVSVRKVSDFSLVVVIHVDQKPLMDKAFLNLTKTTADVLKELQVERAAISIADITVSNDNQRRRSVEWKIKRAAISINFQLASLRYGKASAQERSILKNLDFVLPQDSTLGAAKVTQLLSEMEAISDAMNLQKVRSSLIAEIVTPQYFEDLASTIADEPKVTFKVMHYEELCKRGFGLLTGVGRTQSNDPELSARMIILEYNGADDPKEAPFVIVGKGVTYDFGAGNLKNGRGLIDMQIDCEGALSALHIIKVAKNLGWKCNIVAVAPCTPNLLGKDTRTTGTVLQAYDGTSVRDNNADAEGRLIMADAICYVKEHYKPEMLFTIATLTGSSASFYGKLRLPFFAKETLIGNFIADEFQLAAQQAGEAVCRNFIEGEEHLCDPRGEADICNVASCNPAVTAAAFVGSFVGDEIPHAHLDIAGQTPGIGMLTLIHLFSGVGAQYKLPTFSE